MIMSAVSRPLPDRHGRHSGGHGPLGGESSPDDARALDNPYENTPGHSAARGRLPMARYLKNVATEDEIQALAAQAPPMTEDQRARLARLLRLDRRRGRAGQAPHTDVGNDRGQG